MIRTFALLLFSLSLAAGDMALFRYEPGKTFESPEVQMGALRIQGAAEPKIMGSKMKYERFVLPGGGFCGRVFNLKTPFSAQNGVAYSFLCRIGNNEGMFWLGSGTQGPRIPGFATALIAHPQEHVFQVHGTTVFQSPDGKTYKPYYCLSDKRGTELSRNRWHHIFLVCNRKTVDFYRDGELIHSYDVSPQLTWNMFMEPAFGMSVSNNQKKEDGKEFIFDLAGFAVYKILPGVEEIRKEAREKLVSAENEK